MSPEGLETPLAFFDRVLTPTDVFFVRSHFGPPSLDHERPLTVEGLVQSPLTLTRDALKARFPNVTTTAVLQCAGSGRSAHVPRVPGIQWGHGAMGQATFTGVRLKDVLEAVGCARDAAFVRLTGADAPPKPTVPAFVRSLPMARALDPTTLIAWAMNGKDLSLAHGAPLRLVVPGWAGDHWTKWLTNLRVETAEAQGFYMQTAYKMPFLPVQPGASVSPEQQKTLTTFPVKSIIARPRDGARVPVGRQEVAGCAFSGDAPIKKVEVTVDGGETWNTAALEGEPGIGRWQVFRYRFDKPGPGRVTALVRALDAKGNHQPIRPRWNPGGYLFNAWHTVTWEVA
jgi:DMSO/TMAO reductase YedYZ molybdopterin-dependent catalytic subunit